MYEEFNNELYHHGVKGMKWGVRNNGGYGIKGNFHRVAAANYGLNARAYGNGQSKNPKRNIIANMNKQAQRQSLAKAEQARANRLDKKNAKRERRQAIERQHKEFNKKASFGERMLYNDNTRKLAAKNVVDKHMSADEALKSAKRTAGRNTLIAMGIIGGYTTYSAYNLKKHGLL